jgi:hypothetical protein
MVARALARFGPDMSERADAVRVTLRRALLASLGVALVVGADATPRSLDLQVPAAFVAYSLLIWAVVPALVTLVIVGVAAVVWDAELPTWLTAVVAGLVTAAWVSWAVGGPVGLLYGALLGLGGAGAGAVLGARWRVSVRMVAAVAISALTAMTLFVGFR